MPLNISLPEFGSKSAKDAIVSILAKDVSLTSKELFNRIKSEYGFDLSYQGFHKHLKSLEDENVVEKKAGKYSLSEKWIKNIRAFAGSLSGTKPKQLDLAEELDKTGTANFHFDRIVELGEFLIHDFMNLPNHEKKPAVCQWRHVYSMIGVREEELRAARKKFKETKYYVIAHTTTPLDNAFVGLWEKFNVEVKPGIECASNCDIIVNGDYILSIYYPTWYKNVWAKNMERMKSLETIDIEDMQRNMCETKIEVNVTVVKNPVIADQIREETLKHFK